MPINVKEKGNKFELMTCKLLRFFGWTAETSRYVNTKLDDQGVDIVTDCPLYIQCKATEKAPQFHNVLERMPTEHPRAIFWKKNRKKVLIIMELDEFMETYEDRRFINEL